MATPKPHVIDTSIAAGWFLTDDAWRELSLRVRDRIRRYPTEFVIPHLLFPEIVNVLTRRSGRDESFVTGSVQTLLRFGVRTVALSEAALHRTAHWACRGLSGYDATYVALAEDLGGVWLTADERAAKIAGSHAQTLRRWARDNA